MQNFWKWWKRTARKIGDFQARVILTIFYFVIVGPFALLVRSISDPLALKPRTTRGWQPKEDPQEPPLTRAQRQF